MQEFTADGLIIREAPYGETGKLLTILTAEHGKVYSYAKGVKNINSKNGPGCQLLVFSEFDFIIRNGRRLVKTALTKESFYRMRTSADRLALASYFSEVINHVTMENNDETEALRLMLNVSYALSHKPEIPFWKIKAAFELKLMCVLGMMPDFASCYQCGNTTYFSGSNLFSFEEGALLCEKCNENTRRVIGHVPYSCTISDEVLKAMVFVCMSDVKKILSFDLDVSFTGEFAFVCENYLIHKTERTYETLKIYKSIVNSLNNTKLEKNEEQK